MARSTSKKDLKARIKKLERKLRSSQAEAEKARAKSKKWKKRAKRDDAAVTDATSPAAARARSPRRRSSARGTRGGRTSAATSGTPDATWTVAQLREEAQRRRIPGYYSKSKAALLADLGG